MSITSIIQSLIAVLFISISAQLTVNLDWQELKIPISGQSFAVLVAAMILGWRLGLVSVLLYLFFGGIGLPLFADGGSGWGAFVGGTGGFLIGFALAALLVGWLGDLGWRNNFVKALLAMFLGTTIIISAGVVWLNYLLHDLGKAMENGFYPFVEGAIIKIFLGAIVVFLYEKKVMQNDKLS